MTSKIILKNGSKEEAYRLFDEVKSSIKDFKKESVRISAKNMNDEDTGWRVVKIIF